MNLSETWIDVEGYLGLYQVSNYGRVKSLARVIIRSNGEKLPIKERILKPLQNPKNGYLQVILYRDSRRKLCKVHRLVAEAFIPNPENKPCIDHINTDRADNRVENLRWCTYSENMLNPITIKKISGTLNYKARAVLQYDLQGNFMCEWPTMTDVKIKFGFSQAAICLCCQGKLKSAYGFVWRYA